MNVGAVCDRPSWKCSEFTETTRKYVSFSVGRSQSAPTNSNGIFREKEVFLQSGAPCRQAGRFFAKV